MIKQKKRLTCRLGLVTAGLWLLTQAVGFATSPVTLSLSAANATLSPSQSQSFVATVSGTSNAGVIWTVSPNLGSLSTDASRRQPRGTAGSSAPVRNKATYTAPGSISSPQTATITATSVADPTVTASAVVSLVPAAATAVSVSLSMSGTPGTGSLNAGQTQSFTASVTGSANTAVVWSMSPAVGLMVPTGNSAVYTAPSTISSAQTITITATSAGDPTKVASASISLVSAAVPVSVSLAAAGGTTLNASQTQSFTASVTGATNTAVVWSLNPAVGSITPTGNTAVYRAPSTISSSQVVTITATSVADPTKAASASINLTTAATGAVSVSLTAAGNAGVVTLNPAQTQSFTASVTGSINTAVIWSLSPAVGSIVLAGNSAVYTAPSTISSSQIVVITATSVADPTKTASAPVSLISPGSSVFVSLVMSGNPGTGTLSPAQTQALTASVTGTTNTAVVWSLSPAVGSLAVAGDSAVYTAPSTFTSGQVVTITATSAANLVKAGSVAITLIPPPAPVSVSLSMLGNPGTGTLSLNQSQSLNAIVSGTTNTALVWSLSPSVGSLAASGDTAIYSAPSTLSSAQTVTITATSTADPTKSASVNINLLPVTVPVSVSLSAQGNPSSITLSPSQTQSLTATVVNSANTSATWALSPAVGSLSTSGGTAVYTAPSVIGANQTVTVRATSVADSTKSASVSIALMPLITVTVSPSEAGIAAGQSLQFSAAVTGAANEGVTWSVSPAVGSVDSTGQYFAPAQVAQTQTITVTALSLADHTTSASGTVTVAPAGGSLEYCSFSGAAPSCAGSNQVSVLSFAADSAGAIGGGLRICKGSGCPGPSTIRFSGLPLSVRRGTIAFWFRQNNNNPTSGPTEIFSTFPGGPYVVGSFIASVRMSVNSVTNGTATALKVPNHGLSTGNQVQLSGGTGAWSTVNGIWPVTVIDANNFSISLNSASLGAFSGAASMLTAGSIVINHFGDSGATWTYGAFRSDAFFMPAGQWHHFVWSWTADHHKIYRDGVLVATYDSTSPFPYASTIPYMTLGTAALGTQDISIDEFGSYNFDANSQEAAALYAASSSAPAVELAMHGICAIAVWGPGERKVKVSLDAGDFGSGVSKFHADVYQGSTIVASQDFNQTNNGFAEGLIALSGFPSGTYSVKATAYNSSGGTVGTATSPSYAYTQPSWLGNSYGIDTSVPAPYFTPITTSGSANVDLNVVNRTYTMTGGFGLPMQITSLGQPQLASPITLSLTQSGSTLPLSSPTLAMTSVQPNQANWLGSAVVGPVSVAVTGKLDYDGMMLLTLQFTPTAGPVILDGIKLLSNLTGAAAKYVYAVKDQPFWWYVWSVRSPQATGEFNNNLSTTPRKANTDNIFETVFSDDDRGLEIFHNNMAGWQINESAPWQHYIRNVDGSVTYECDLANETFTLSQPIQITIGYMATPVKNMPTGWRLAAAGAYGGRHAPTSHLEYQWDFSLGNTWNTFSLFPTNLASYLGGAVGLRGGGKLDLPFTNAHVLVPTAPATAADMQTIAAETLNDGWNSSPSRGAADYWAWSMNHLLNDPTTPNVVDGYYIDESYSYLSNASLLTGAGYIKADGSHGVGLNLLGAREKNERLAKLLIAAGKTPNLWMHTTAYSAPHMYSHATMTLDGERPATAESYYVDGSIATPSPDFFDTWNNNNSLLDPTQTGSGSWLLGTAQTRKFGFIPIMWKGIGPGTYLETSERQAECLYQMSDTLQQDQDLSWWQTKANFGIDQTDVTFHGYTTQQEIQSSDPGVKVTYYLRSNSLLAYIANFDNANWSGTVNFGTAITGTAIDAENGAALPLTGTTLNISVNRHDCRIVQIGHQ